ncbi:MAG: hypothetical protein ACR2H5_06100 [Ktedonobacteraceae bacterium]
MVTSFFRALWVILRKDIRVWLRQPTNIAATFLPPISFLLVLIWQFLDSRLWSL